MSEVDWSKAPEWANKLMMSKSGDTYWCNDTMYLLADGEGSSYVKLLSDNESDIAYSIGSFKLIDHRPDAWQEGEERMNNIGPNGNEGEHYEAGDIDISEAVRLQNEAHDKRVLDSIKNSPDYEVVGSSHDNVNHPEHYQSEDGIECIDAIRASLGLDGFVAYCRGNAIKYAWRSGKKANHAEDLRKAAWYLEKAASELDK